MINHMTTTKPPLFHSLTYADAYKGLAFLAALGFEQILVVRNDNALNLLANCAEVYERCNNANTHTLGLGWCC